RRARTWPTCSRPSVSGRTRGSRHRRRSGPGAALSRSETQDGTQRGGGERRQYGSLALVDGRLLLLAGRFLAGESGPVEFVGRRAHLGLGQLQRTGRGVG